MTREHIAAPRLGRYEIDTSASSITFGTRHLFGLGAVRGRFGLLGGTVDIASPPAESAICARLATASFKTGNPARDAAVRSARFLDAGRFPVITFRAGPAASQPAGAGGAPVLAGHQPGGGDGQVLAGTLTVGEVTRPVRLLIERVEVSAQAFTARASARIDRAEFGVTAARGLAARYLDITVEVRCERN
ncbi:MAG TPA: YceI family protein [Streptosporangiaceae bacterium]